MIFLMLLKNIEIIMKNNKVNNIIENFKNHHNAK